MLVFISNKHGCCYAVIQKEFCVTPQYSDNIVGIGYNDFSSVTESPKKDKNYHRKVMKKLGLTTQQINNAIKDISYY